MLAGLTSCLHYFFGIRFLLGATKRRAFCKESLILKYLFAHCSPQKKCLLAVVNVLFGLFKSTKTTRGLVLIITTTTVRFTQAIIDNETASIPNSTISSHCLHFLSTHNTVAFTRGNKTIQVTHVVLTRCRFKRFTSTILQY